MARSEHLMERHKTSYKEVKQGKVFNFRFSGTKALSHYCLILMCGVDSTFSPLILHLVHMNT